MSTIRSELAKGLRDARIATGLNQTEFAKAVGISQATVSRWESGNMRPTVEQFQKLIQFDPNFAQFLPHTKGKVDITPVMVIGEVSAGTWKPAVEWDVEEQYEISAPLNPKYGTAARRVAFVNRGDSMNLVYQDGDILIAIVAWDFPRMPETGDHVIVQRQIGDEFEATCKEFVAESETVAYLMPRSTNPAHKPIVFTDGEGEVTIIGFVEGHYRAR